MLHKVGDQENGGSGVIRLRANLVL